jgi:hypothetical protein
MVYIKVSNSKTSTPDLPSSVTGNGQTYTQIPGATVLYDTSGTPNRRITWYYALIASASAGRITVNFGAGNTQTGCMIEVIDVTGLDTSSSGANSFRNVVTAFQDTANKTPKVTLAAFNTTNNPVVMGATLTGTDTLTADALQSGYTAGTAQSYSNPNNMGRTQWRLTSDTAPQFTTASNNRWGAIAFELVVSPPSTDVLLDAVSTSGEFAAPGPQTWAHVVGSGAKRLMVAVVTVFGADEPSDGDLSYGGKVLTEYVDGRVSTHVLSSYVAVSVWYLVDPPSGSNTFSAQMLQTTMHMRVDVVSFSVADQVSPFEAVATATGTGGGVSATAAVSVTTITNGAMAIGAAASMATATAIVAATVQNNREKSISSGGFAEALDDIGAVEAAGAAAFAWTITGSSLPWCAVAISIRPAGTTGPGALGFFLIP